jgi:pimeloyl-ACP methyl ester carboxylesterase
MKATRVFTPTRIVALAVIGVLVLGLGYLRLAPGDRTVPVPAGAKAGDLTLHACTYATERGAMPADCGTLVVPENRSDPDPRLIALPVTRIRARSDHPAEPVFYLEGGPGITNINFKQASRFAEDRDVVLVGYRGVDGSVRLNCPEVTSALKHSTDALSEESFRGYGDALRACADRLTDQGVDLAGYGLAQQVDDLEAARVALGYDRIHLLSQSAGTRTAMISTQVYEYVPDVPAALAEVYRVLRPGGRVLILDTDWDSIVWAAGDQARMQRLLAAWADRFADPHLPRSLSWQLEGAGFQVERREVLVLFNPEYDPDTYSVANGQIMADFAVAQGRMPREEVEAWMGDLQHLGSQGRYFFSLNRYLFLATRRP